MSFSRACHSAGGVPRQAKYILTGLAKWHHIHFLQNLVPSEKVSRASPKGCEHRCDAHLLVEPNNIAQIHHVEKHEYRNHNSYGGKVYQCCPPWKKDKNPFFLYLPVSCLIHQNCYEDV